MNYFHESFTLETSMEATIKHTLGIMLVKEHGISTFMIEKKLKRKLKRKKRKQLVKIRKMKTRRKKLRMKRLIMMETSQFLIRTKNLAKIGMSSMIVLSDLL